MSATERAEEDTVAVEVIDRIAWVRFNRPEKRNCMSPKLNRQMKRVLEELEFREDVGVLVLTGEGDAWSAGMDLKEYFRETEAQGLWAIRKSQREAYSWWERLRWYEKPTIAMINGWCFGGGYGPLFACDMMGKDPVVLRAAKEVFKRVRFMDWETSNDYIYSKTDASNLRSGAEFRQGAMHAFLDEKKFKPGLATYDRNGGKKKAKAAPAKSGKK